MIDRRPRYEPGDDPPTEPTGWYLDDPPPRPFLQRPEVWGGLAAVVVFGAVTGGVLGLVRAPGVKQEAAVTPSTVATTVVVITTVIAVPPPSGTSGAVTTTATTPSETPSATTAARAPRTTVDDRPSNGRYSGKIAAKNGSVWTITDWVGEQTTLRVTPETKLVPRATLFPGPQFVPGQTVSVFWHVEGDTMVADSIHQLS